MLSTHIPMSSHAVLSTQTSLGSSSALLRSTGRFRDRPRHGQQCRAFRFGPWSSYFDSTVQKELRQRHRVANYKYVEAVTKKLSWDRQQLPDYAKNVGLKGFMCSAWHRREPRVGGRWGNFDFNENSGEPRKSERKVEDGQTNLDRHLRNLHSSLGDRLSGKWQILDDSLKKARVDYLFSTDGQASPKMQQSSSSETKKKAAPEYQVPTSDQEYEIDPITNRKIMKSPIAKKDNSSRQFIPVPAKTFSGYGTQFHGFKPPTSDASATAETKRLAEAPTGAAEVLDDGYARYDAKYMYSEPFMAYEPDGKAPTLEENIPDPVEEGYKVYDQKVSQEKQKPPLESTSSTGEKAAHIRPILKGDDFFNTEIGQEYLTQMTERMTKKFEDMMEQETVRVVKSMPKPKSTDECLKAYDSKVSYSKPFMAFEANDGKSPTLEKEAPDLVEQGYEAYDSKMSYEKPFLAYEANDGKAPEMEQQTPDPAEEGYKAYDLKHPYGPVYHKETNSQPEAHDPVQDGLREYDSRVSYSPKPSDTQSKYHKLFSSILDKESIQSRDDSKADAKGNELRDANNTAMKGKRANLEQQFNAIQSKAWEKLWFEGVKNPKSPLISCAEPATSYRAGNEAARVPETNDKWTAGTTSLLPSKSNFAEVESKVQNAEKEYIDGLASRESYPRKPHTPRLQPALDRTTSEVHLNTSNTSSSTINLPPKIFSPAKPEPTLYKVLAYDPTTQSISTADTTSIVPDTSSSLTPAEVLLRLSNPAKFVPHLGTLQEDGYEIASGSGDVLVFRKVGDGKITKVGRRNPIDGMQAPPTGNFASPTGFVNYDTPVSEPASESSSFHQSSEDVGKERFKSNIDVRREEPVFSGGRRWEDEGEGKKVKRGRGKRLLIGAVWVGACSYAVGVVAEFFKTGGLDGAGIKGF